jgi:uncharacterized protein involved in outer membrane biogenesis
LLFQTIRIADAALEPFDAVGSRQHNARQLNSCWAQMERTMELLYMPKKRALGIVALVAVVVILPLAAALIVPHVIDSDKYHKQVQAQLEKRLGRKVSLANLDLSLLPPSFRADSAVIAEDTHFNTGNPFATAEKLKASVRFWPLLRGRVEIKSLELDRPRIELVKDAQGSWNFSTLGQERKTSASPAAGSAQVELDHLLITDGQVAITDEQQRRPRAVYDHIYLDVRDFAPDRQFSLKVSALLPGAMKQAVMLEGNAGPIQPDTLQTPFDGRLHLDQVPTGAAAAFLNTPALNAIEGVVSGEAKVKNSNGKLESSGAIRLDDLHVHNVNVGYPVTMDYDITHDAGAARIHIRRGEAKLGSTPVTVEGSINTQPSPVQVDVKFSTVNASIAETARLVSAFGGAFFPETDATGQMSVNLQAQGAANHPVLTGKVSARDLVISSKDLAKPVKVGAIDLAFTPEKVRSNEFHATCGSTTISATFALSQYSTAASTISGSLLAPNAKLEDILTMARAAGFSTANGVAGEGGVSLDVRAEGPMKDLAALSVIGKGKLQNATLTLPSLGKPVQIHHADLTIGQNSTTLHDLSAKAGETSLQGALTINGLAAPQVQFTLHTEKMNVREMQQFLSPPPVEGAPANQSGILSRMTGEGSLTAGVIQFDSLVLGNAHLKLDLDHGLIHMNSVSSDLFGGKQSGNITIDMRPAQPVYSVSLKTDKVDAAKFISSVSTLKETLHGLLAGNVNGTFSSNSAEAIARSLNGHMELNLNNGKLMNLDLQHELAEVGKFVNTSTAKPGAAKPRGAKPGAAKPGNFTNLTQLSGTFNVQDGVATTSDLKATIEGGALTANGQINLAGQALNLHVIVVLNKTLSQQVGGTQIGGIMNTALANDQKELVLPVILTGAFERPQVAPDLQQIAHMKQQNRLPTASKPNEFNSSMLEGLSAGKSTNPPGGNGTEPSGGPRGTLTAHNMKRHPARQISVVNAEKRVRPSPTPTPKE